MSPFLGDDDMETIQNISSGEYEYPEPEEDYEDISDLAKEFIDSLLKQLPRCALETTLAPPTFSGTSQFHTPLGYVAAIRESSPFRGYGFVPVSIY